MGDFKELPSDYVAGCGTRNKTENTLDLDQSLVVQGETGLQNRTKDLELVLIQEEKEFPSVKKNQSIYLIWSFLYTTKKY